MSNVRYNKQCCQKEKECSRNIKHCVKNAHHLATEVTSHEKCAETSSIANYECTGAVIKSASNHSPDSITRGTTSNHNNSTRSKVSSSTRCYPQPSKVSRPFCKDDFVWQRGKYVKDECGSGIQATKLDTRTRNREWCKTPLTMYQSTIGELARKMLCNEIGLPKRVNGSPPCNVCEYVLPLCRGYYRKYECRKKCEEEHATFKDGKKVYRDVVQQYWMPCLSKEEKHSHEIGKFYGHNEFLGNKLRRKANADISCW